jgi:RND family efflux transporter MFP subunit
VSPADPASRSDDDALARELEALRVGSAPEPARDRPSRRSRRRMAVLAALLLALALGAGGLVARRLLAPPEVSLVAVGARDLGVPEVVLTASGYVEPRRQITVSSKAQGKIVEMPVEENQRVRAGELIARLENDEQRAALRLAEAEFADAARELERKRELRGRGSASESALERAETAHAVARARLELAQVAVANTVLRAPFDGTVIRKVRDVGEFLTIGVSAGGDPGTAVVVLADLSSLDVALEIGESELRKVALGAPALVHPEALPERRYLADVTEIASMANRQKGVVPVKVRIRQPDRELLPDLSARVSFLAREPEGAIEVVDALPASAVVERDGERFVFALEDDRVRRVGVATRPAGEGYLALERGPASGTYVVDAPPPDLADGARVRVRAP